MLAATCQGRRSDERVRGACSEFMSMRCHVPQAQKRLWSGGSGRQALGRTLVFWRALCSQAPMRQKAAQAHVAVDCGVRDVSLA